MTESVMMLAKMITIVLEMERIASNQKLKLQGQSHIPMRPTAMLSAYGSRSMTEFVTRDAKLTTIVLEMEMIASNLKQNRQSQ